MIESRSFQLAQVNVARMRAPMDDPMMDGFTRQLEFINACAERSPGFVWRLQTDDGDATGIAIFGDPELLVNPSGRASKRLPTTSIRAPSVNL